MIAVIEQVVIPGTRFRLCDPRQSVLNCQRFDSLTRSSVLWPQTVSPNLLRFNLLAALA